MESLLTLFCFGERDSFFKQVIALVGLCLHVTQNMAQSHFRVIVITQNSLRLTWTQGWCMLILCEGSGWGPMES